MASQFDIVAGVGDDSRRRRRIHVVGTGEELRRSRPAGKKRHHVST